MGTSDEQSLLEDDGLCVSTERPAKRPANEIAEVEPLPIDVECKKQKHDDSIEYEEDNAFLEMVKTNYLIREGMMKHLATTCIMHTCMLLSHENCILAIAFASFI